MRQNSSLLGEEVYCPPLSPAEIKAARARRAAIMWARFLRLLAAEGRPLGPYMGLEGVQSLTQTMRGALRKGFPSGWYFLSALEAADLGMDEPSIAKGEPTQALPGTREKLEVLADRAKSGIALWHPEDGKLRCD